jgi:hypothetical protein
MEKGAVYIIEHPVAEGYDSNIQITQFLISEPDLKTVSILMHILPAWFSYLPCQKFHFTALT